MIGVGHGMMSSMCRLKLQWEKPNNLLPTSVVCKLTPTGLPQRVLSRSSALLKMEYLFYGNIDTEKANNDIIVNIPEMRVVPMLKKVDETMAGMIISIENGFEIPPVRYNRAAN